jgi:hypothetical protein
MTTTDYLINAVFVFVVLRQARERQLDVRSFAVPMIVVFYVARLYVHSIPTAGNDLQLVALLSAVGLTLGVLGAFATHVRADSDGMAFARVGWLAGALLIGGISARMVFVWRYTTVLSRRSAASASRTTLAPRRGRLRSWRWRCSRSPLA